MMAENTHIIEGLVLTFVTAILVEYVRGQNLVFSQDITMDFSTGNLDVSTLLTQDFLKLPLAGYCPLAAKFVIPHVVDTPTSKGTFRTTFEYLTSQCTAEFNKEYNDCSTLNLAFAECTGLALDQRVSHRPWGYCTNQNFRVSYLWVPKSDNSTTPAVVATTKSINGNLLQSKLCLARGVGVPSTNATNPAMLATLRKDIPYLNRMAMVRTSADAKSNCDWSFSNLIPVAWDGIQNVLSVGKSLQSADAKYMFIMQKDCNLVLYRKASDGSIEWQGKWATFSQYNDPFDYNCSMELQPNGNLVVRDPRGIPDGKAALTQRICIP